MKKLSTYFLIFLIFWGISLNAQNQITNPGFEDWTSGAPDNWVTNGGAITLTQNSSNVNGGTYSCEVTFTSTSNQDLKSESFSVTPGQEVNGSVWIFDNDPAGRARISVIYEGGDNFYGDYSVDNSNWQELTFSEIVPTGATSGQFQIRFYDVAPWDGDATILVDDASYEVNTSVNPEPTNHATNLSASIDKLDIALSWSDATGGQEPSGYILLGSTSDNISTPVDGTSIENDFDFSDGSFAVNRAQGDQGFDLSMQDGLILNQNYYFKLYPYSNSGSNIDYKTDGTVPSTNGSTDDLTLVHQEYFENDLGAWSQYSVSGDNQIWDQSVYNGFSYADMSGYDNGAVINEDWLISPSLNLSTFSGLVLNFLSAYNYDGPQLELYYSINYSGTGNPNNADWTALSPVWPSEANYTWTNSGDVSLPSETGFYLGFKYESTDADAPKWEVTNILITAAAGAANPATQLDITDINGGSPVYENQPFAVKVQAKDASGSPANVDADVDVTLSVGTGSGTLGGTITGTISSGSSFVTISGVTYGPHENGVILNASDDDSNLTTGNSDAFNVLEVIIPDLLFSEVMYHAMAGEDSLEYIEIYNNGSSAINLQDFQFTQGVTYTFGSYNLAAGDYVLVAKDASAMLEVFGVTALEWNSGQGLSNSGEDIELQDNNASVVAYIDYLPGDPWPQDEVGHSIRFCDYNLVQNNGANWSSSVELMTYDGNDFFGSPGEGCGAATLAAEFEGSPTTINEGNSVDFTDLSTGDITTWSWTFEGGTPGTSSVQNPQDIVYNTPGTYNVTLVVGDGTDTDTETKIDYVTVNEVIIPPVADFEADDTDILEGESVNFTDLSSNNPTTWAWTFEGGTPATSNEEDPSNITYNSPGTYNVTLTVSNDAGNDTEFKSNYITVNAIVIAPVANFTADQTSITTGETVQFTDLSTNDPTSWSWTFDGGTPSVSNTQSPSITYNTAGVYDVTLFVQNAAGDDELTKTAYITVTDPVIAPVAEFEANNLTILEGESVNFTDLSTNDPTSWSWTFEGGTPETSTDQNPQNIVYASAGTFNVSLTVSNSAGSDTETKNNYITVNEVVVAPVAAFTSDETTIYVGQSVQFTDQSNNDPTDYTWTFEGGTPTSSTATNPLVTYNTAGIYDVSLEVENSAGSDVATETDYITVLPATVGDLVITEIMYNPPESGTDSLEYIEIYNNSDQTVNLLGYYFFGVEYTFPDTELGAGEYVLVAVNADAMQNTFGVTAFEWESGSLLNTGELIKIISPTNITVDSVPYLPVNPWPSAGNGMGSSITICNPEIENSVGQNWHASVNYLADNAAGAAIYGSPGTAPAPVADFSANLTFIEEGEQVQFTNESTCNYTSLEWTFEGGTPATSSDENPLITYATAGTYNVTLTVSNATGSNTMLMEDYIEVTVAVLAPVADFTADQTSITTGESVQFTDLSTNEPTSWAWSFDGGTPSTSNTQSPIVTYNTAGVYDVTLFVENAAGDDELTKTAYITVTDPIIAPVANFTADQTSITTGESVQFTDLSTNEPTSWSWTFDGGTPSSSSNQSPSVTYNTAGVYDVTLFVENAAGNDELTKTAYITVADPIIPPVADFTADQTSITTGESVQFTDLSTNEPSSWAWSFDGGTPSTSNTQSPSVTYNTAGVYDVTLFVENAAGDDELTKTAYITVTDPVVAPVADFTANQTTIFVGQSVQFTDQSTNEPTDYSWTFEGGTPATSSQANPLITYNSPGIFDVSLMVENSAGSDELTETDFITVLPATVGDLVITEIMYNPPEAGDDSLEYIEIYNNSADIVNLLGYTFTNGIVYTFPDLALPSEAYIVIANNATAFEGFFGSSAYQWTAGALSNGGELVKLVSPTGATVDSVPYANISPWPEAANGGGPSISICNPEAENSLGDNWHASTRYVGDNANGDAIYGSPGMAPAPVANFIADITNLGGTGVVNFTDLSTCNAETYEWEFEGGTPSVSSDPNPTVTYNMAGDFDVSLTVTNASGSHTLLMEEYIHVGVGFSEIDLNQIHIMPNPSTGLFKLSNPNQQRMTIEIYSILGQQVWSKIIDNAEESIDLNDQENGVYLMQINLDNQVKTIRLIKQ